MQTFLIVIRNRKFRQNFDTKKQHFLPVDKDHHIDKPDRGRIDIVPLKLLSFKLN
jgi:hypothetical protein